MRARAVPLAIVAFALVVTLMWGAGDAWSSRALPVAEPIVVTKAYVVEADTLRRNEAPALLFARHNIRGPDLLALTDAADGINWRRMQTGQVFQFRYALDEATPNRVTMRLGDERVLTLHRDSAFAWRGESEEILWSVEVRRLEGVIESSLYEALEEYLPDSILPPEQRPLLLWDLADGVFGWVVDFTRDNYPGDRFTVLYERLTSPLGDVRYGRVVAARVETRGQENSAYVLTDENGRNAYYDADGRSLKRAFKMYPVSFKYISSGFSRSRFHPILKTRRPHLGVDYAASRGTSVVATGDGVVTRADVWGGYGKVVVIRHPKDIETRYAHLNAFERGIRPGVRVTQGQRIGFAGMTGLASAPHVHYEFIKNGAHTDPRQAARFGQGEPVASARRAEFESARAYYDRLLDYRPAPRLAASSD
jgi:murein DD-endopeptidase MepM/ murein hydrolase activator NlpD